MPLKKSTMFMLVLVLHSVHKIFRIFALYSNINKQTVFLSVILACLISLFFSLFYIQKNRVIQWKTLVFFSIPK